MEKALLVTVRKEYIRGSWVIAELAQELEELAASTGVQVVDNISCGIERPTPNFFIGKGKVEEIALTAQEEGVDTVIFSCDLSATQQRNLEDVIGIKTIDRTQLILDIFAQHARSPEGKMQVELAQLGYLLPRLIGKGIILSRLGGGIGTRGPGEQKLEVDRRRIRSRIEHLKSLLVDVRKHRANARKRRKDNAVPSVALVGYTNAGKSTLLNALTDAGQQVQDKLFTTLDPLTKGLKLPNAESVTLSDTVGFLHELPHTLIEAFKATLEEVIEADLLLHVVDASHPQVYDRHKSVLAVLAELGAESKPVINVFNKIDLLDDQAWLAHLLGEFPDSVAISASRKQNIGQLLERIQQTFSGRMQELEFKVPHSRMDIVNRCYREGKVVRIEYQQRAVRLKVLLPKVMAASLCADEQVQVI